MIRRIKNLLFTNHTVRQTVVKNTFWLFSGEIVSRLIRAIIVIYSARVLGVAEYGVFSYAISIAGFVSIFADLGISAVLSRESIKNPEARQDYFSTALSIKVVLMLINTAVLLGVVPFVARVGGVQALLPIIAFLLIFDTARDFSAGMFRSLEKMEHEALMDVVTNVAITSFGLLGMYLSATAQALTVGYVLGSAVGFLVGLSMLLPYFRQWFSHFRAELIGPILRHAWPIGLLGVLGSIMINTDMLMLGWWKSATQLGYYAAGQKPILLLYIGPTLLASAFFPTFARLAKVNNERFRVVLERSIAATLAIALPIVAVGAILAPALLPFVFGAEYAPAVPTFMLLLVTLVVVFPSTILANALFAYNEQRQFMWFVGIGAISNAVLDYFLIPRYGIEGSAIATIIAQFLTNALVWRQMKATNNFSILGRLPRIFLAAILCAATAYALTMLGVHVLIILAMCAVLYFMLLWIFREPLFSEVREVLTRKSEA